jgi:hypothetical protein
MPYSETFALMETPFELSNEGKIAVSIDYMTKKWNYYYQKRWRKTIYLKNIDDYKKYLINLIYNI